MEGSQGGGYSRWSEIIAKEVQECVDGEWVEDEHNCAHHRFGSRVCGLVNPHHRKLASGLGCGGGRCPTFLHERCLVEAKK